MSAAEMPVRSVVWKRAGLRLHSSVVFVASKEIDCTFRLMNGDIFRLKKCCHRDQSPWINRETGPVSAPLQERFSGSGIPVAVACIFEYRRSGESLPGPPAASSISAATPAASGAAALVPKKLGQPLPSLSNPKNVVSAPSTAV